MKTDIAEDKSRFYEFDSFRVDSVKRLLLRDNELVPLSPKAFDTLVALIRFRDRILNKDDLIQAVWADTIVEENNLTQSISAIRKALGERRSEHRYVVTVPGRGYRFVAEVRETFLEASPDGNGRTPNGHETGQNTTLAKVAYEENGATASPKFRRFSRLLPTRLNKRKITAGITVIIALGIASGWWILNRAKSAATNLTVSSIAVLPFKPLDADLAEKSLGRGMADALITKLSNVQRINVRPTSAVLRYANATKEPLAIGRELGVDAVIDGHVQRTGDRLRVSVQMSRTSDGATLWARSFDERFTDIFAVQDSISEQVAAALQLRLSSEERQQIQRRFTQNADAYQAFLKAHGFMNRGTKEDIYKSIQYFRDAINLDSNYALAYAGLSDSYSRLSRFGVPPDQYISQSRAAAIKALEVDETVPYAHSMVGRIAFQYDWDFVKAEREYKRARALNPDLCHEWYAFYLLFMNRPAEGDVEIKRFADTQPMLLGAGFARYLYFKHQYDEALKQLNVKLELAPKHPPFLELLGMIYEQQGKLSEAIPLFQEAAQLSGGQLGTSPLGHLYAVQRRKGEARRELGKLVDRSKHFYVSPYELALVYAGLGEEDAAIEQLEKSYSQHSLPPASLRFDPRLDKLRAKPRFQEFMRRVGLGV